MLNDGMEAQNNDRLFFPAFILLWNAKIRLNFQKRKGANQMPNTNREEKKINKLQEEKSKEA